VSRVGADRHVAQIDVVGVLGQAGPVQRLEGHGVAAGQHGTIEVDVGLVAGVGLVEHLERRHVRPGDLEGLARERLQVVDRVVRDVIAGGVDQ
jgi:hypothetical protein